MVGLSLQDKTCQNSCTYVILPWNNFVVSAQQAFLASFKARGCCGRRSLVRASCLQQRASSKLPASSYLLAAGCQQRASICTLLAAGCNFFWRQASCSKLRATSPEAGCLQQTACKRLVPRDGVKGRGLVAAAACKAFPGG